MLTAVVDAGARSCHNRIVCGKRIRHAGRGGWNPGVVAVLSLRQLLSFGVFGVSWLSRRDGAHLIGRRLNRVQTRLRGKAFHQGTLVALSGSLLVSEPAEQDGQDDGHEEKHDAAAGGNDTHPCWNPFDSLFLSDVGAEKREQEASGEKAKQSADVAA